MKRLLTAVLLTFSLLAHAQKQPQGVMYDAKILRVTDGDTVVISAPFLPAPLKPELSVRVFGVDTPEKGYRAKCMEEDIKGESASKYTKSLVKQAQDHRIIIYGWDKYGGRVLGDVILNGQSLRSLLIQNGYAREYYGSAKLSWCNDK